MALQFEHAEFGFFLVGFIVSQIDGNRFLAGIDLESARTEFLAPDGEGVLAILEDENDLALGNDVSGSFLPSAVPPVSIHVPSSFGAVLSPPPATPMKLANARQMMLARSLCMCIPFLCVSLAPAGANQNLQTLSNQETNVDFQCTNSGERYGAPAQRITGFTKQTRPGHACQVAVRFF